MVQQKGTETTGWRVRATSGAGIAMNCIAEARGGLFDTALDELERRFKMVPSAVEEAPVVEEAPITASSSSDVESESDDESDDESDGKD